MTGETHFGVPLPPAEVMDVVVGDDEYILATYGLSPAEADAAVAFGAYEGRLRDILPKPSDDPADPQKCPVGGMLAESYGSGGIAAVSGRLELFGQMDPRFSVRVSERTQAYHEGALDKGTLLDRVAHEAPQSTSFLAQLSVRGLARTRRGA